MAVDSKSAVPKGTGGSNPSTSAGRYWIVLRDAPTVAPFNGQLSEWPKELVLKTCVPQGTVGSNPTLPALCTSTVAQVVRAGTIVNMPTL
jgi:hypothetical protein